MNTRISAGSSCNNASVIERLKFNYYYPRYIRMGLLMLVYWMN